ncbi:microtubule-associated proteins 1A/1B light chain 3A-like isoform X1 [Palaemon carinicauda]|uniref:microtubule-associated proteins 1A/1B light chain 3A-like isoform X1 n=1 Tax=Palaemon carinicauda TaxID=392227 RepID=UPI0035B6A4EC
MVCTCVYCLGGGNDCLQNLRSEKSLNMQRMEADVNPFFHYKRLKAFVNRKDEASVIRSEFPGKIPVVVERWAKENHLPYSNRMKFLVPQEITMSQFLHIVRNRLSINSTMSLYLLVNNTTLVSLSKTLAEVYRESHDDDGFLYVTYASQEVFG